MKTYLFRVGFVGQDHWIEAESFDRALKTWQSIRREGLGTKGEEATLPWSLERYTDGPVYRSWERLGPLETPPAGEAAAESES